MYPSPNNPGYGSFVKDQIDALIEQGIQCEVVTSSESRRGLRYTVPKYLNLVINSIIKVIRTKYDIIHAHYIYPTAVIAFIASYVRKSPYIVTVHGSVEPHYHSFISKYLMGLTLKKADHIIVVGSSVRDELVEKFSITPSRVSRISMGVDTRAFKPVPRFKARKYLKLPQESRIIISIGAIIWRKGFHLLLHSIAEYPSAYENTKLIIVGDGPLANELINLSENLGITHKVQFAGAVDRSEIPLWLSASDCYVHPALDEAFGMVIIEAMSCQKLVVATPVGGIIDYITDGENGYLIDPWISIERSKWVGWVDPFNIKAIAERVEFVLTIPPSEQEKVQISARRTAEKYNVYNQAAKVKRLYLDYAHNK